MGSLAEAGVLVCRLGPALRLALTLVVIVSFLLLSGAAYAGGGPRDVLVVINSNSDISRDIGRYYQAARGIPESNICYVSCPDQEIVSGSICQSTIVEPIRRFLTRPEIAGKIDYIVLTKGTPLGATYPLPPLAPNTSGPYSITCILTCLENPDITDSIGNPYGPLALWQWGAPAPETAWSHSLSFNNHHFYLVTRLDAFAVDQVKQMIDGGIHPASNGAFALDKNGSLAPYYVDADKRLGDQAGSAYARLISRGYTAYFDAGSSFISDKTGLMGYFSWACNDIMYTFTKYTSNRFVPGSIGDSYWSFSARTFNDPNTTSRDPLIADLIPLGICGVGGYVSEPQIKTATYPNILFDRYTKGYNLAESFYAACPQFFWKTVVVGDPLMAPYARPPLVTISLPGARLNGIVTVTAQVSGDRGVSKVKFYLDDELLAVVTQAPFNIGLDTTNYPIGSHYLEAIAYENSPVAAQGSNKTAITIDNPISAERTIGAVYFRADGQAVRLTDKAVTAGSDEIGGSFYIEEIDRSCGIKVNWPGAIKRGGIVTVIGTVRTESGDRVIDATSVTTSVISGAAVGSLSSVIPGPLMIRIRDLGGAPLGYAPPVGKGTGARNVALLVRVAARVSSVGVDEFYMDERAGRKSVPVKISCPGVSPPAAGRLVAVTGVVTSENTSQSYAPVIRVRDYRDIQPLD